MIVTALTYSTKWDCYNYVGSLPFVGFEIEVADVLDNLKLVTREEVEDNSKVSIPRFMNRLMVKRDGSLPSPEHAEDGGEDDAVCHEENLRPAELVSHPYRTFKGVTRMLKMAYETSTMPQQTGISDESVFGFHVSINTPCCTTASDASIVTIALAPFKKVLELLAGRGVTDYCQFTTENRGWFTQEGSRLEIRGGQAGAYSNNEALLEFGLLLSKAMWKAHRAETSPEIYVSTVAKEAVKSLRKVILHYAPKEAWAREAVPIFNSTLYTLNGLSTVNKTVLRCLMGRATSLCEDTYLYRAGVPDGRLPSSYWNLREFIQEFFSNTVTMFNIVYSRCQFAPVMEPVMEPAMEPVMAGV